MVIKGIDIGYWCKHNYLKFKYKLVGLIGLTLKIVYSSIIFSIIFKIILDF